MKINNSNTESECNIEMLTILADSDIQKIIEDVSELYNSGEKQENLNNIWRLRKKPSSIECVFSRSIKLIRYATKKIFWIGMNGIANRIKLESERNIYAPFL